MAGLAGSGPLRPWCSADTEADSHAPPVPYLCQLPPELGGRGGGFAVPRAGPGVPPLPALRGVHPELPRSGGQRSPTSTTPGRTPGLALSAASLGQRAAVELNGGGSDGRREVWPSVGPLESPDAHVPASNGTSLGVSSTSATTYEHMATSAPCRPAAPQPLKSPKNAKSLWWPGHKACHFLRRKRLSIKDLS
jgi:hypothetical protein